MGLMIMKTLTNPVQITGDTVALREDGVIVTVAEREYTVDGLGVRFGR
jgi:hypothetical protein